MAVGLDYSAWVLHNDEIKRRLIYTDTRSGEDVATIYFDCRVGQGLMEPLTFISFKFTPFRVIDGLDLGISLAPLRGGERPKPVGAMVTSVDDGEAALLTPRTPQGLKLLLSHMLSGEELKFGIWQGPEQLVDLPYFNDREFARLHQDAVNRSAPPPPEKKWFWQR